MRIAIVSDTHFDSNDQLLVENWRAVERWLQRALPDLVVHLGDITAKGSRDAAQLAFARGLLGESGFVRAVPGNHDIGDSPTAPGQTPDEPLAPERLADYRRLFGPDYWCVTAPEGWRLVGLNALLMATGLEEEEVQFAWLARTLEQGRGPVGVFLHKPLCRDRLDEDIVHLRYVAKPARLRLMDILASHDLRFVAAGHTHQLRRHVHAGVEHVWAPSAAFTVPDFRQERIGEKSVGVMLLELEGETHRFTPVFPSGLTGHSLMDFPHIYPALIELRRQHGYPD